MCGIVGAIAKRNIVPILIEGLKRHWLFRSAFKEKPTNAPPKKGSAKPRP